MDNPQHQPLHLCEVLEEEYVTLHGPLPQDYPAGADPETRLTEICRLIHRLPQKRSAICFSGGGIRSATFGLGILQGLARHGLLDKFDYLSTVSGGGYIGGWFSAWIHRQGLANVQEALRSAPIRKLQAEAEPVRHLRSYSNYMSPRLGLLSADTWTLVAIFFRNLFLNWLVLIPLILGVLVVPRICVAVANWGAAPVWAQQLMFVAALVAGIFSIAYIIANRPSLRVGPDPVSLYPEAERGEKWFIRRSLLPLVILAVAITTYWAWLRVPVSQLGFRLLWTDYYLPTQVAFILFGVLLYVGALVWARLRWLRTVRFAELVVAILTGAIGGTLTWVVAAYLFPDPVALGAATPASVQKTLLYVCLALPLFLLLFLLAATVFVGLASYYTTDADREWLARAGAWMLILIVSWSVVSSLVIFGPVGLLHLGPKMKALVISLGSGAGLLTLVGGFSSKTPAKEQNQQRGGPAGVVALLSRLLLTLAAPVFAMFVLVCLSFFTSWLIRWTATVLSEGTSRPAIWLTNLFSLDINWAAPPHLSYDDYDLLNVVYHSPGWYLLALALVVVGFGVLMGYFVNINKFSLHAAYRDRLIRAYLGASRTKEERRPNPFTGMDEHDNLQMQHLRQKPFHVVNITLNLVGGTQLAWQDRKAESFTISPLHSGSYCVGYRSSTEYARNKNTGISITLGTAAAISGAAASPNMGYYSSSAITFLMTLFNVRLGWWLGNPGHHGAKTYNTPGPDFAPRPLIAEALGLTTNEHPFVYLSDGGHFENLGLYEMVLRRCHFIVISDGAADPSLTFNDLGNAISKIREDLGIPIVFGDFSINLRERDQLSHAQHSAEDKYCAIGRICYSCKDGPGTDGILIYIKPVVYGGEPTDVYHYARSNPDFPHESTGDQMYSETQFESYRMLGSFIIETICKGGTVADLDGFLKQARTYLGTPGAPLNLPDCPA
jgi:hypothetical protein